MVRYIASVIAFKNAAGRTEAEGWYYGRTRLEMNCEGYPDFYCTVVATCASG